MTAAPFGRGSVSFQWDGFPMGGQKNCRVTAYGTDKRAMDIVEYSYGCPPEPEKLSADHAESKPPPSFEWVDEKIRTSCTHHPGDACDWGGPCSPFEGSCDVGFEDNETVVTDSKYVFVYRAKNVSVIVDACDHLTDGSVSDGEHSVTFRWDGGSHGGEASECFGMGYDSWSARAGGRKDCVLGITGTNGSQLRETYFYSCP